MSKQKRTKKKNKVNQNKRIFVLFLIALVCVFMFIVRLLYLQVFAGEPYRRAAISQRRRSVDIAPKRGIIYDRNKNPLAVSVIINTCYLFPPEIQDKEKSAELYAYILGLEKTTVLDQIESKQQSVRLKQQVSQEEIEELKNSGLTSYSIEQESYRYYPNENLLSQTVGFVNQDGDGIYGIEAYYNEELKGNKGRNVYSRDLHGGIIPVEESGQISASAGKNLYLTIDLDLQKIIKEELDKAMVKHKPDGLTAILMEPSSGGILAMESLPSFDPNDPMAPSSDKDRAVWNNLTEDQRLNILYQSWSNPNVSNLYEPGSVLKAVTTAISLETKSYQASSTYLCTGKIEIAPGVKISCHRRHNPHGEQTLEEALINSCNPAFVQIVNEIGPEKFYSYLQSLRLNDVSGVDLPAEPKSQMPDTYEDMSQVQMATMSYGHGISLTPLQTISVLNTTINGGYYKEPHLMSKFTDDQDQLVSQYEDQDKNQIFSNETVEIMQDYLYATAQGPSSYLKQIEDVEIGGKSGTTEKIIDGEYSSDETYASYWSFFPADDPKYSLLVIADTPSSSIYGGVVSGEISLQIISRIIEREKGEPVEINGESLVKTPNLMGLTVEEASQIAQETGLNISVYGDMGPLEIIESQNPNPGEFINRESIIEVQPMSPSMIKIPDFTDMTPGEVEEFSKNGQLEIEIQGQGSRVVNQEPKADEKVNADTRIRLQLGNP